MDVQRSVISNISNFSKNIVIPSQHILSFVYICKEFWVYLFLFLTWLSQGCQKLTGFQTVAYTNDELECRSFSVLKGFCLRLIQWHPL